MRIPSHEIRLGEGVDLHPQSLHSQNLLAYGGPGAGKTTLCRLIYERAPPAFQQIIIDTEDELHTLRGGERDYAILGGEYADQPGLEDLDWRALAGVVVKLGTNFIFQINDWPLERQRAFIRELCLGLLATPRDTWRPMIFGLDETDQYAPNGSTVGSSEAVTMLAKRGRKRGWSCLFATQRMSLLSADVRGMCRNQAIGLANQTLDRNAAAEILGFGKTSEEARGLRNLATGEFWAIGPAFGLREAALVHFEDSETHAPRPGADARPVAAKGAILKALAKLPKRPPPATVKLASADGVDDEERRAIHKGDIDAAEAGAYARGLEDGKMEERGAMRETFRRMLDELREQFADDSPYRKNEIIAVAAAPLKRGEPVNLVFNGKTTPKAYPVNGAIAAEGESNAVARLRQAFLKYHPRPMTLEQAYKLDGGSPRSSSFVMAKKELRDAGFPNFERVGDKFKLMDAFARKHGAGDIPSAPADVVAMWRQKLSPTAGAMLQTLFMYRRQWPRDDWAAAAGASPTSSSVVTAAKELVDLGLAVKGPDGYSLSPDLRS